MSEQQRVCLSVSVLLEPREDKGENEAVKNNEFFTVSTCPLKDKETIIQQLQRLIAGDKAAHLVKSLLPMCFPQSMSFLPITRAELSLSHNLNHSLCDSCCHLLQLAVAQHNDYDMDLFAKFT